MTRSTGSYFIKICLLISCSVLILACQSSTSMPEQAKHTNTPIAYSHIIFVDKPIISEITQTNTQDWYKFIANKDAEYVFSMTGTGQNPLGDPMLSIYSANGELIKALDFETARSLIGKNVFDNLELKKGEYYIAASASSYINTNNANTNNATGEYTLNIALPGYGPDTVAGNSTTEAKIKLGDSLTHALQNNFDSDWFRFDANSGNYKFSAKKDHNTTSVVYMVLRLYNDEGNPVTEAYSGLFGDAELNVDLTAGRYFVELTSVNGLGFGFYTLSASQNTPVEDDFIGNASTRQFIAPNQTKVGKIQYPNDQDWFKFEVAESDVHPVTKNAYLSLTLTTSEDNYINAFAIKVYDSEGAFTGTTLRDSMYIAPDKDNTVFTTDLSLAAGDYYFSIEGGGATPSDYSFTVKPFLMQNIDPISAIRDTTATIDPTGGDGVIDVYFYDVGERFGGADSSSNYVSQGWNEYQQQQVLKALRVYENYINLTFKEVQLASQADFHFITYSQLGSSAGVVTFSPGNEASAGLALFAPADVNGFSKEPNGGMDVGGNGFYTLVHEIGHLLGLSHPVDNAGNSSILLGINGENSMSTGEFELNQGVFTIMSMFDTWQAHPLGNPPSQAYGRASTPMALDLVVLQEKFGANMRTNINDTLYSLPSANGINTTYKLIWDSKGEDTVAYTGTKNATIDLRPASLIYEYGGAGHVSYVDGIFGGFTIANGVTIEKAVGGNGNDHLIGNQAANYLFANAGNDVLTGNEGVDTFVFNGKHSGNNTITDFTSEDVITITDSTFKNKAGILAAFEEHETGAILKLNANMSILLKNVDKNSIQLSNVALRLP